VRYSEGVMRHFRNPRNIGSIPDADGVGQVGDPSCGDSVKVWIKVEGERIKDVKYKVTGCAAAIAACNAMTELAMGRHIDDAAELTDAEVAKAVGGLPEDKMHCSNLAASALYKAIMNYVLESARRAHGGTPEFLRGLRSQLRRIVGEQGINPEKVPVEVRSLSPAEIYGDAPLGGLPASPGAMQMVEASVDGARGQAGTDEPGDWSGSLQDVLCMPLKDQFSRAIFVATLNGVMRSVGQLECTLHCKDERPGMCARKCVEMLTAEMDPGAVAMIGYQPRLFAALVKRYDLCVVDFHPEMVGRMIKGVKIVGPDRMEKCNEKAGLLLVSGRTLINGTFDKVSTREKPAIFYGVTATGPARLLGLRHFCPYAR